MLPHLACRVALYRRRIELSLFRLTVIIVDTIGFTPVDKMLETIDWADAGCTACSTAQTQCQVSTRLRVESPSWLSIVVQINSSVPALEAHPSRRYLALGDQFLPRAELKRSSVGPITITLHLFAGILSQVSFQHGLLYSHAVPSILGSP